MTDVIVLGATGFTGRLITRYLYAHPAYRLNASASSSSSETFTFSVGARSLAKLKSEVAEPLSLSSQVPLIEVDVRNVTDLERAFGVEKDPGKGRVKVVINTVGPYWRWGTNVVAACARHGIHYVDLTGETAWIRQIVNAYDFIAAAKTHAIIIPSCGFDSVPSDIAVYLANKALKRIDSTLDMGHSVSAIKVKGSISGGTVHTAITMMEEMPKAALKESTADYVLSPVRGPRNPRLKILNILPHFSPPVVGAIWGMALTNRAIVHRTWGLFEARARSTIPSATQSSGSGAVLPRYGPEMTYEEFLVMPNTLFACLASWGFALVMWLIATFSPVRWLVKTFGLQPGSGPSEQVMQNGYLELTNVSSSAPSSKPTVHVKTVIKGKGDPGYLLTSVMISETALSLILPSELQLTPLGREGGILTPMSACGEVLIDRLERSGRFVFESGVLSERDSESKKVR